MAIYTQAQPATREYIRKCIYTMDGGPINMTCRTRWPDWDRELNSSGGVRGLRVLTDPDHGDSIPQPRNTRRLH